MNIAQVPGGVTLGEAEACCWSPAPPNRDPPWGVFAYCLYLICMLTPPMCSYWAGEWLGEMAVRGVRWVSRSLGRCSSSRVLSREPAALCPLLSMCNGCCATPFTPFIQPVCCPLLLQSPGGGPYICLPPRPTPGGRLASSCPESTALGSESESEAARDLEGVLSVTQMLPAHRVTGVG